jgi:hypothetical protein
MGVDGSRAGPASGASSIGVHHRYLPITSAAVMGRPALHLLVDGPI